MSLSERIRDHLRETPTITAPEAQRLFGLGRSHACNALAKLRDAGVIVPMSGRYPRRYRLPLELHHPARGFAPQLSEVSHG